MSIQVFISYKSEYRDFAREVKNRIHSWGYKSWLDVDEIPDGSYFRFEIDKGLKTSDVVVGVITEEAQESREVLFELDFAIKKNKPLLPLKYRECELMYHLESIQWIDFTKDAEAGFDRLHKRLTQLADSAATPTTEPSSGVSADYSAVVPDYFSGKPSPAESIADGTAMPDSPMTGGLMEDAIPKPNVSAPIVQPSAPILPPMQASPARRGGGILGALAGILMLPFAGIAALIGWLRSSGRDEAELARTNRAAMLAKVQEFWVVGVLENALKESGAFDLGLSAAPGAVLKHIDYGDYALPTSANIGDVFNDLNRELLILGAPGAGKTIMLLQLARDLIARAQIDSNLAMPAVFNLSSWAAERKPLEMWLVDELRLKYQVPKKVAQTWVETEQLTLLLDGLDEVAEDYRNACVEAINAYRQKYAKTDLAVCSRIADYDVLTTKLDLRGGITLQPLSMEQIDGYIDHPGLSTLRDALQTDSTLQEMARTPFLLNTMAYAYQDISSLQIPESSDRVKTQRTHLFNTYVEKRLSLTPSQYTAAQTRRYLRWLAHKMVEFKQSVFYIENLDWNWLGSQWERSLYKPGGMLIGLILGAFSGGMIGNFSGTLVGFSYLTAPVGLGIGIIIGAVVGLILTMSEQIHSAEYVTWSFHRQALLNGLLWSVVIGTIVGLVGVPLVGLHVALVGAWLLGFIALVSMTSAFSFKHAELVSMRIIPNQGIRRSLENAILIGIIVGIVSGLAGFVSIAISLGIAQLDVGTLQFILLRGLSQILVYGVGNLIISGIALGVAIGLLSGVVFGGGEAVIKHVFLRLFLLRPGDAPLNYARFLDYCASIQILRKVGGGYIFVHRYLLEYFAELEA